MGVMVFSVTCRRCSGQLTHLTPSEITWRNSMYTKFTHYQTAIATAVERGWEAEPHDGWTDMLCPLCVAFRKDPDYTL